MFRLRPITCPLLKLSLLQVTPSQEQQSRATFQCTSIVDKNSIEFEVALELEQQGFLIVKTMARHHMDTEGQKNGANEYEEKP